MKKLVIFISLLILLAGCNPQTSSDTSTSKKGDVIEDICAEFSADFVYSVIRKPIVKVEPSNLAGVFACKYYTDYKEDFYKDEKYNFIGAGGPSVSIVLENLNVENQKKANELFELKYESNPKISMENMIVYRKDNSIWSADVIINPNRFVWANYSNKAITDDQLIDLAVAIADKIQGRLKINIEKNPIDLEAEKVKALGDSQESVARNFFDLLGQQKFQDAVNMMDANQQTKNMWLTNFQTLSKVQIKKVEEIYKDEWTPTRQVFKFTLDVSVNSQGEQYGWQNGENYRWLTLQKNNNSWQVHEIANNP